MSTNPSDGIPPEQMQKLQESYRKTLPERLKAIEDAIGAVQKNASADTVGALRFLVHKLAGNAGSFGYAEVSRLSKELEQELIQILNSSSFDKINAERLLRFYETIKKEFHFNG